MEANRLFGNRVQPSSKLAMFRNVHKLFGASCKKNPPLTGYLIGFVFADKQKETFSVK